MNIKRTRFLFQFLSSIVLFLGSLQIAMAECGPLDGSTTIYSDTNLSIGSGNSTVNGVSITDTNSTGTTGLEPDGTIDNTDLDVPLIDPPTFPSFSGGSNVTVGNREHKVLSAGIYDTISAQRTNTSVTFNAGDYYISTLDVKQSVDLIFNEGSYFIDTLKGENDIYFIVKSPDVRIYIGTSGDFGNKAIVAKDTSGTELDSITDFQVYVYDGGTLDLNNTPTFKGLIVGGSGSSITFGNNADFHGSVQSQGDVSFGQNAEITYTPQDQSDLNGTTSCVPIPDPIGHWSFDNLLSELVADESGNALNGTLGSSLTTDGDEPTAMCSNYLEFDGSNDLVNVPDSNELDIVEELTVTAWVRPESYPSRTGPFWNRQPGSMTVVSKDTNYEFHIDSDGKAYWWWNNSSGTARSFRSSSSVPLDQWTHIAIVYSKSAGTQTIYINGVADASTSYSEDLAVNSNPLQIGGDQGQSDRYFNGDIDDVYVFNAALSESQLAQIMGESPSMCAQDDALAYYVFDGESWNGTSGEVIDWTGNNHNGFANGNAVTSRTSPAIGSDPGTCEYGVFDGNGDYLRIPDGNEPSISNTYSISLWINADATQSNNSAIYSMFVDRGIFGTATMWGLHVRGTGASANIVVTHNPLDFNTSNESDWDTGIDLGNISGGWHHITVVRDGSENMTSYLDGAPVISGSNFSPNIGSTIFFSSNLNIGRSKDSEYFSGSLDELAIFNQAITQSDVQGLMATTRPCPPIPGCNAQTIADDFASGGYSGGSGWSSDWVEINDNANPNNGNVYVSGGRVNFEKSGGTELDLQRSADLTDSVTASLSFTYGAASNQSADLTVSAKYDDGSWNTLFSQASVTSGSVNINLPTNTFHSAFELRLGVTPNAGGNKPFYIDDVELKISCGAIDHLEISVGGTASTCSPLAVTVKACEDSAVPCVTPVSDYDEQINLSVSTGRGDWSNNTASGSVANGASDDGIATYQFVAADGGDAILDLAYLYADKVTITATDSANGLSVTSGVVTFSDNAFIVKWNDSIHSGADTDPTTAVAGRDHSATVSYIAKDAVTSECQVVQTYSGVDKSLSVWMTPTAGAFNGTQTSPQLMDTADNDTVVLPFAQPGSGNFTLDFVNGVANIDLVTADVGQFIFSVLDDSGFVQDENGNPIDVLGASSQVTVRPFGFALDIGDGCAAATGDRRSGTNASVATDHTESGFWAAGNDFSLSMKAVAWAAADDADDNGIPDDYSTLGDNACLASFGNEVSPAQADLSLSRFLPAAVDGGVQGSLSVTSVTGFSSGIKTQALNYSEVGIIDLDASLTSYLGVSGADVVGELHDLGRFYPYEFEVVANTIGLEDGPDSSWSCNFTYQDQLFRLDRDIELTLTAKNALGNTTTNYEGNYWKLSAPSASVQTVANSVAGDDHILGVDTSAVTVNMDTSAGNGVGTLTFSGLRMSYQKETGSSEPDSDDVSFAAEIDWILPQASLTDVDNSCYRDAANNCDDFSIVDITNGLSNQNIRYGRASIGNNAGSELLPLELPIQIEQWMLTAASGGQYVFETNSDDNCTGGWSNFDVTLSTYTGNLASGETTVSVGSVSAGIGVLQLSAPGSGNEGSVNAQLDVPAWLEFDFYGRGAEEDPTGTGSFGVYSGRQPIFYLRESYR